jgi:hypothetical protein
MWSITIKYNFPKVLSNTATVVEKRALVRLVRALALMSLWNQSGLSVKRQKTPF